MVVADHPQLRLQSLTLEAWIRLDLLTIDYQTLLGKPLGGGSSDSYVIWYESQTLRGSVCAASGVNSSYVQVAWSPAVQTWHHVAFTYDGATGMQVLFIDGSQVASQVQVAQLPFDTRGFYLGSDIENGNFAGFLHGGMSEARLWSVARSPTEIAGSMRACLSGTEPGLVGYWHLDEPAGQVAHDSSPNHLDGTLGLGPTPDSFDPIWNAASPF